MNSDNKSFIEELRSLSEPAKRKILWIAVAASMVFVMYLWFAYFDTIMANSLPTTTTQASVTATASDMGEPGLVALFATAAGSLWQAIGNQAQDVASALKNPRQYDISPK